MHAYFLHISVMASQFFDWKLEGIYRRGQYPYNAKYHVMRCYLLEIAIEFCRTVRSNREYKALWQLGDGVINLQTMEAIHINFCIDL